MKFSLREERLLSFAFDPGATERLHKAMVPGEAPEVKKKTEEQRIEGVQRGETERFLDEIQGKVSERSKRFEELPTEFRNNFHRHIADYLVMNVPRFDRNRNRVIETSTDPERNEFARYKGEMRGGIDKMLAGFLSIEDRAKAEAERRKREAEVKKRSLDDQLRALREAIDKRDPEKLSESPEFAISNPQELEQQMKQYDERAKAVSEYGNKLQQIHQEVMLLPEKWQEYLKPTATDAAIVGGAAAAGAAVGVWIFGFGAIAGALIGAASAAAVNAARAAAIRAEQEAKAQEVKERIKGVQDHFARAQEKLSKVHSGMERGGTALLHAPGHIREEDRKVIEERRSEIAKRRAEVAARETEGKEAALKVAEQEQVTAEQRKKLAKAEMELRTKETELPEAQRKLEGQQERAEKGAQVTKERREGLEAALKQRNLAPDQRAKIEAKLKTLEEGEKRRKEAEAALRSGTGSIAEQREKILKEQQTVREGGMLLDGHAISLLAARGSIHKFLAELGGQGVELVDFDRTIAEYWVNRNEELDIRTEQVGEGVTQALLSNHLTIGNLTQYQEDVGKIPPIEPRSWGGIIWSHTFESIGKAWNSIWSGLGRGIQGLFGENAVTNFLAGLSEAVGAFGEGIMHMAAHLDQAAEGILAMVNVFNWEKFTETYAGLWGFLTAKEDFEAVGRGESGASEEKAWGKAIGNFALFLIPGYGAVSGGVRGAAVAFRLARGNGAGLIRATVAAAERVLLIAPAFTWRIAKMPVDMVLGIARLPMGIVALGKGLLSGKFEAMQLANAQRLAAQSSSAQEALALARSTGASATKIAELTQTAEKAVAAAASARKIADAIRAAQAARNALKDAQRAASEGRRLSPQEQELVGMAQREKTLAAATENLARAQADLRFVRAEGSLADSGAALSGMKINGRSVGEVAASKGGLEGLANMSDAQLGAAFGVNSFNPFAINKLVQLRKGLTGFKAQHGALVDAALGQKVSPAFKEAVWRAHCKEGFGKGQITYQQIKAKYAEMLDIRRQEYIGAGKTPKEALRLAQDDIRILMDRGVAGFHEGGRTTPLMGTLVESSRAYKAGELPKIGQTVGYKHGNGRWTVEEMASAAAPAENRGFVWIRNRVTGERRFVPANELRLIEGSKPTTSPTARPSPGRLARDAWQRLEDYTDAPYMFNQRTTGPLGPLRVMGNAFWRGSVEWLLPRKWQMCGNYVKNLAADAVIKTGRTKKLWRDRGLELNPAAATETIVVGGEKYHILGRTKNGSAILGQWSGFVGGERWVNLRGIRETALRARRAAREARAEAAARRARARATLDAAKAKPGSTAAPAEGTASMLPWQGMAGTEPAIIGSTLKDAALMTGRGLRTWIWDNTLKRTGRSIAGVWNEGGKLAMLPKWIFKSGGRFVGELTGLGMLKRWLVPPKTYRLMKKILRKQDRYRRLLLTDQKAAAVLKGEIDALHSEYVTLRTAERPSKDVMKQVRLDRQKLQGRQAGTTPASPAAPAEAGAATATAADGSVFGNLDNIGLQPAEVGGPIAAARRVRTGGTGNVGVRPDGSLLGNLDGVGLEPAAAPGPIAAARRARAELPVDVPTVLPARPRGLPALSPGGAPLLGNKPYIDALQQRMDAGRPITLNIDGKPVRVTPLRFEVVSGEPPVGLVIRGPTGSEQTIALEGLRVTTPKPKPASQKAYTLKPDIEGTYGVSPPAGRSAAADFAATVEASLKPGPGPVRAEAVPSTLPKKVRRAVEQGWVLVDNSVPSLQALARLAKSTGQRKWVPLAISPDGQYVFVAGQPPAAAPQTLVNPQRRSVNQFNAASRKAISDYLARRGPAGAVA